MRKLPGGAAIWRREPELTPGEENNSIAKDQRTGVGSTVGGSLVLGPGFSPKSNSIFFACGMGV